MLKDDKHPFEIPACNDNFLLPPATLLKNVFPTFDLILNYIFSKLLAFFQFCNKNFEQQLVGGGAGTRRQAATRTLQTTSSSKEYKAKTASLLFLVQGVFH